MITIRPFIPFAFVLWLAASVQAQPAPAKAAPAQPASGQPASAQAAAPAGFPFQDESLRYSINWPSGLSLGEASMSARHSASGWVFDFSVTAGIPGFSVSDSAHASATQDLCAAELTRDFSHGSRKGEEKTTFDQQKGTAHRVTLLPSSGGSSDLSIPACARDALTYVYYGRRELGQGRVPPEQKVFYGSGYSVRKDYTGPQTITGAGKPAVTDQVVITVKGPQSSFNFSVFYARDAARTPLEIRVPLAVGTLTVELVR
jgi:hypothetical protein